MQRQYRLKSRAQFRYVYRRGKRASAGSISLLYVKNARKLVGFSIGKKVGNAVVRNRIKRRLRECIRPCLPKLKCGLYIFAVRPEAAQATFDELRKEVLHLLTRQNLLLGKEKPKPRPVSPSNAEIL